MMFPNDIRFPGVYVESRPLETMRGPEMRVTATFTQEAHAVIGADEIEKLRVFRHGAEMMDHAVRGATLHVMRLAAVLVLRHVRADWSGLWAVGLEIVAHDGTKGTITRIDYGKRVFSVAWDDGRETGDFGFDEAIDCLVRGAWKVT